VESLKQQGEISEALFSIYLADNDFSNDLPTTPPSNIIIGGYDLETYGNGNNFTYVDA
jgi:hypothetical protein